MAEGVADEIRPIEKRHGVAQRTGRLRVAISLSRYHSTGCATAGLDRDTPATASRIRGWRWRRRATPVASTCGLHPAQLGGRRRTEHRVDAGSSAAQAVGIDLDRFEPAARRMARVRPRLAGRAAGGTDPGRPPAPGSAERGKRPVGDHCATISVASTHPRENSAPPVARCPYSLRWALHPAASATMTSAVANAATFWAPGGGPRRHARRERPGPHNRSAGGNLHPIPGRCSSSTVASWTGPNQSSMMQPASSMAVPASLRRRYRRCVRSSSGRGRAGASRQRAGHRGKDPPEAEPLSDGHQEGDPPHEGPSGQHPAESEPPHPAAGGRVAGDEFGAGSLEHPAVRDEAGTHGLACPAAETERDRLVEGLVDLGGPSSTARIAASRPRGDADSLPVSRKVGQCGRHSPHWTQCDSSGAVGASTVTYPIRSLLAVGRG
jgi:hypothetical protein